MSRGRLIKLVSGLISVALLVALLAFLIFQGYQQSWTGFGAYLNADGKIVPPKRLWDWLSLFIVPFFLAVAAWGLNESRKASDARTESDRQRQKSLDDYLEWTTALILAGHLDGEEENQKARSLTRTKTLAVLRVLDGTRKAQVLQFLYEAGLLQPPAKISLVGADFRGGIFDEATLVRAEIRGAFFSGTTFRKANLRGADLRGCDFVDADFSMADLHGANLKQVVLSGARLVTADLSDINLEDVDLSSAKLPLPPQVKEIPI
jgi:hypothetical protein